MKKIFCVMEYVCPKTWESLAVTGRDDIRFCDQCKKKVYLCASQEEVDAAAELGKCVAFYSVEADAHIDTSDTEGIPFVLTRRTLGLPSNYMSTEGKEKMMKLFDQNLKQK